MIGRRRDGRAGSPLHAVLENEERRAQQWRSLPSARRMDPVGLIRVSASALRRLRTAIGWDAVGEDSHQRVANGETARTGGHQSDRRGSERGIRPARRRIHGQEKRLLVREAQQLDQRIVGRRILDAIAAGSFGDAFET
jgi:hypothetical protein